MTQEEMMQAWRDTSRRLDRLEREIGGNGGPWFDRRRTSLDDLAYRYRFFAIIGMIMIPVIILFYYRLFSDLEDKWTIWPFIVYFVTASCMDWWLFFKVRQIDVVSMSTETVATQAALCKKRHHQFMMILIPMMATVMVLFIYSVRVEYTLIQGAVIGAIFGIFGGIRQYRRFMEDYRMLIG